MKAYILQMCNVEVSVKSTKNCRNYGGLNLDEFEIFWDICTTLCPRHFGMKHLSLGSETVHSESIYIADVQRRGFSLIDQKLSKLRGSERGYLYNTLSAALW